MSPSHNPVPPQTVRASAAHPCAVTWEAGTLYLDGAAVPALSVEEPQPERWRQVTYASMDEYAQQHAGAYPAETLQIMRLFAGFIARHIDPSGTCLDIGCGTGSTTPPYADRLMVGSRYVGLDPLRLDHVRDYPFICARIEELPAACPRLRFAGFIFATSLDHLEELETAAQAVAKLAHPEGAMAVLWIGLHDRDLLVAQTGARLASTWLGGRAFGGMLRALAWPLRGYWRTRRWLDRRDRDLSAGRPLDNLHFHYFTRATLAAALAHFGKLEEVVEVPGTNSCFAAVRVLQR